ncbi:hypothetical protein MJA45_19500 [Paenibacillus aurantius]|uniref:Uncharacterized protein n=1 Tax=Paenibacillus aurantius TaxID=2918900 RepID=A0AA96LAT6_9BACL|nr:hypothetical protein [Paenibacillus aurantius]WNQ09795.1 hypothetical protein MJA45_19500 [Paenibacillus aurantius]
MKKSKWFKWQAGAVGAAGLALLFNGIKASPAFTEAVAKAKTDNTETTASAIQQDAVMNEFHERTGQATDPGTGTMAPGYDRGELRGQRGRGGEGGRPDRRAMAGSPGTGGSSMTGSGSTQPYGGSSSNGSSSGSIGSRGSMSGSGSSSSSSTMPQTRTKRS